METGTRTFVGETCRWISWRFLAFRRKATAELAAPSERNELQGWSLGIIREDKNAREGKMALVAADFWQFPKTLGQLHVVVFQNGANFIRWRWAPCQTLACLFSLKQSPRSNSCSPDPVCLYLVDSFAPEACVFQMGSIFPLFLSF